MECRSNAPEQPILFNKSVLGSYGIILLIAVVIDVSTYYLFALSLFTVHVARLLILCEFNDRSLVILPNAGNA